MILFRVKWMKNHNLINKKFAHFSCISEMLYNLHTWSGCVGWSWCGVDSWTWARGQDRERGGVAAVRLLTTWVGWIIDHYTAGWQVGVPWTSVKTQIKVHLQHSVYIHFFEWIALLWILCVFKSIFQSQIAKNYEINEANVNINHYQLIFINF